MTQKHDIKLIGSVGFRFDAVRDPGDYVGRHRLSANWAWRYGGGEFRVNMFGGAHGRTAARVSAT